MRSRNIVLSSDVSDSSVSSSDIETYLNQSIGGSSATSKTSNYYGNQNSGHFQFKTHAGNEDKTCYFEFEIRQIKDNLETHDLKNLTFLSIKDITTMVKNQQKLMDKIY